MQTGDPYEQEVRLRGKDGIYRWFLSRAIPMRESCGKVVTWYGTSTDIEEMKRVEAELQKAIRVREEFLAIAGHELKTPLAALQLQVQGIQHAAARTLEPDGLGKILDRLARASGQLRGLDRLVNNLLDVSRMGEGKLLLNPEFVDLTRLVRELIATYADAAQKIGSAVRLSAPERLVGNWDRLRIEQVVTNLLANGLKYGRGKPVEIEVERDGDTATLRVRDHGIGIDSEQQARIFDRFARAVSDREFGGLGLGLWIVRRIVEASGGRVTVQSAAGRGATFTVRLPITSASSIRVTSDRNAAEAEPP